MEKYSDLSGGALTIPEVVIFGATLRTLRQRRKRSNSALTCCESAVGNNSCDRTLAMATSDVQASNNKLDAVADVDIDGSGKFKYILLKAHWTKNTESEKSKYIVRGYAWAGYHVDIYEDVDSKLHKMGLDAECVGGGRIAHEPEKKTILVYGYSQGYGRADHSIAVELLKKRYPDYDSITFSNDGY